MPNSWLILVIFYVAVAATFYLFGFAKGFHAGEKFAKKSRSHHD